ncbi:MAG TPA: hypothetical protein VEJ00_14270 [Candidatus Acidoferrales bacterium]|nr:hypothetical protein [Candidatus Acidoferrales bacterium]
MSLRDWLRNSWLVEHETSPEEIAGLLAIVERDLANAKVAGLSEDWQLNIAYNAALQAATAALAAAGYRATREQHHYRTIQSLAYTVGWPPAAVGRFDRFRKKRNITGYETAGVISMAEAQEMYKLAEGLRDDVVSWLKKNHPKLLKS